MKQWMKNLCDLLEVLIFLVVVIAVTGGVSYIAGFFLFKFIRWVFYL